VPAVVIGSAPSPAEAFGEVLVRLAGERPSLVLLTGEDPGPVAWFAEIWPERVLVVPPVPTRVAVAEGVVHGGGDAVVLLDGDLAELPAAEAGIVLATVDPAHLHLAFRARVEVCQPGWTADVPALLVGALGTPTPTLLHLPAVAAVGEAPPPTTFGEQRPLHRGRSGLVLGGGATAATARAAARALARRHLDVTALDLHTIDPASGVDAGLLHDHLLVGPLDAPRAAALQAVPADGTPGEVADRLALLLARAPHGRGGRA
jgi:hypothetical protein